MTYNQYYICHHGIKGQKWGVRRYQYEDGTLTEEGKRHRRALIRNILIGTAVTVSAAALITYGIKHKKKAVKLVDYFTESLYDQHYMKRKVPEGKKFVKQLIQTSKSSVKALPDKVRKGTIEGIKSIPSKAGAGITEGIGKGAKNAFKTAAAAATAAVITEALVEFKPKKDDRNNDNYNNSNRNNSYRNNNNNYRNNRNNRTNNKYNDKRR